MCAFIFFSTENLTLFFKCSMCSSCVTMNWSFSIMVLVLIIIGGKT